MEIETTVVIWLDCRRRAEWVRIRGVEGRRQRLALVSGATCRLGAFFLSLSKSWELRSSTLLLDPLIHLGLYQLGIQVGHNLLRDD